MHEIGLFDTLPIGIILFDEKHEIISINDWGNEFINKTSSYMLEIIRNMVIATSTARESIQKVIRCCDYNEFLIWSLRTEIIHTHSPQIAVIIQDKTAHTKLEQSILKAEKLSLIGYLAIGSLLEIRNPLTSAMGFCRLIEESGKVDKEYFDIVSKELQQIHAIIENYADISDPMATRCIESMYHKLWIFVHSKIRSYRLIMVTDSRDDSLIGYTSEEQVSSVLRFMNSLDLWAEDTVYVANINFSKKVRSLKIDLVSINGLNNTGRSKTLIQSINRYKVDNHQIKVQMVNYEAAEVDLNFDVI